MKLLADESLPYPIVLRLRDEGFDVLSIMEFSPGLPDQQVLDIAIREARILLTMDKDFGDLVYKDRRASAGVVLFRLHGLATTDKAEIAATVMREHSEEFANSFTVVTPRSVRIRK